MKQTVKPDELKAKVDFHKTIFEVFFISTLTSVIGLFSLYNHELARLVFHITIPLFAFGSAVFIYFYTFRNTTGV